MDARTHCSNYIRQVATRLAMLSQSRQTKYWSLNATNIAEIPNKFYVANIAYVKRPIRHS